MMARTGRLLFDNVCYHVISRGNQRQKIFSEENDYNKYLEILGKAKVRFKFHIYCYCLMTNHTHLIIDPDTKEQLAKGMQVINQSYTRYFNYQYKKVGHLWQGRFKSIPIRKDKYLIDCINYIETNPIRANIVKSPFEYKWSSYKSRALGLSDKILDEVRI